MRAAGFFQSRRTSGFLLWNGDDIDDIDDIDDSNAFSDSSVDKYTYIALHYMENKSSRVEIYLVGWK